MSDLFSSLLIFTIIKTILSTNSYVLLQVLVMGYILERLPIEPHYVKLKISFSQNVDMIGHNLFMNKQKNHT
jgi:hypothetical protein